LFWERSTGKVRRGKAHVVDYSKLAEKAKANQDASNLLFRTARDLDADPIVFFQRVTALIGEEMDKANEELRKRGVGAIARNHLPGFKGAIFLAFGTGLLCKVELEVQKGRSLIAAAIIGPPNGYEISRKEYLIGPAPAGFQRKHDAAPGLPVVGAPPEQIAEEVVAGILIGRFY
jgi:hypothetical protein